MGTVYNRIAGQSLERLGALSDGIFAVAMTLLVLDLRVPASEAIRSEQDLLSSLAPLSVRFLAFVMSFLTLGIFWVGQQTQLNHFARSDRNLAWIQIAFLLAVSLMPFSTGLLAEYSAYRTAIVVYWLNILFLGLALLASLRYAWRAGLIKDGTNPDVRSASERRIIVAQGLYTFGALLCIVNTYLSIAFILLVQLNYVFAPRLRSLYRL